MASILTLLKLHPVEGDIGVEVEVETENEIPLLSGLTKWDVESDNSLRGYSAEFVTKSPMNIAKIGETLSQLQQCLKNHGVKVLDSFRAGVHIHINCQKMTLNQVATFAAIYYCLEQPLTKFCGPTREGNFFCLRLSDAEAPLSLLIKAISDNKINYINTDNIRYSALNLRSLFKHGSMEFRAMATRPDLSRIEEWAKMLYNIKEYSLGVDNRFQIAHDISFFGPETWAEQVIGTEYINLISYNGFGKDILKSMRNIQELIYLEQEVYNETS